MLANVRSVEGTTLSPLNELRSKLPTPYGIKGDCQIGFFRNRFKDEEETMRAMMWISFLNLLTTYYVKKSLFSLATIVGTPLHLDMMTISRTRPKLVKSYITKGLSIILSRMIHQELWNKYKELQQGLELTKTK
ncbi:hypothetical protein HAX54_032076, partial [Datura stramonium]|nr:hypothetical protein [Datura stramonium]